MDRVLDGLYGLLVGDALGVPCESHAQDLGTMVCGAVALGHDTDTTACVAGGLAGLHFGVSGIPQGWLDALRGPDLLAPLVTGLKQPLG